MSGEQKCPELSKLPRLLCLDKLLPPDFLEHARGCEHCLFWTSYALAAQEACYTTDRIVQNEKCPASESLGVLLLSTLHVPKVGYVKKIRQDIFNVNSENLPFLYKIKEHVNGENPEHCPWCRTYYGEIFNAMIKLQKRYESNILAGDAVRPTIKNKSQTVKVQEIDYDPTKKPN